MAGLCQWRRRWRLLARARARDFPFSLRGLVCVCMRVRVCCCDASVEYRVAVVVLVAPCVKKQAAAGGPLRQLFASRGAATGLLSARNGEPPSRVEPWGKRGGPRRRDGAEPSEAAQRASDGRTRRVKSVAEVGLREADLVEFVCGVVRARVAACCVVGRQRQRHTVVCGVRVRGVIPRRENNGVDLQAVLRKRARKRE